VTPSSRKAAVVSQFEVVSVVSEEHALFCSRKGQLRIVIQAQAVGVASAQHVETALAKVLNDTSRHIFIEVETHVKRLQLLVGTFSHRLVLDSLR